jgi:hypothetical protein
MTLWPDAVILDGTPIPLADVLATATIHHGRSEIYSEPSATTAQVTFHDVDHEFTKAFRVGADLVITAREGGELVSNGGAEAGAAGWRPWNGAGAIAADPARAHTGAHSFRVDPTGTGEYQGIATTAPVAGYRKGAVYTARGWFYLPAGLTSYGYATCVLYHLGPDGSAWHYLTQTIGVDQWGLLEMVLPPVPEDDWNGIFFAYIVDVITGPWFVDDLSILPDSVPRFTGKVTDAQLDDADLTAIAAGRISTLGQYAIGAVPWPQEAWSARLTRVFTEAGLDSYLDFRPDPAFDPQLAPRDPETAGATTVADYLAFLAPMVGAAIVDGLDGTILVQCLGARTLNAPAQLDPADVQYAPAWTQVLPIGNVITVRYQGDQGASVTVRDDASVAIYGERPATINTTFVAEADADTRARAYLSRGAYAHWNILEAPILRGLTLEVGSAVTVSEMPPASPFDPWTPILEGWQDQIDGESWTMLLALSDPLLSGLATLPWDAIPPEYLWTTINQETEWREAVTLAALAP